MPPLSLDGSYNLSGNQPIQTLLFVTQCSSTCREGNCGALLCAHDLEEEVVVTVKVQLYRTSEIVYSQQMAGCVVNGSNMAEQVNYGAVT